MVTGSAFRAFRRVLTWKHPKGGVISKRSVESEPADPQKPPGLRCELIRCLYGPPIEDSKTGLCTCPLQPHYVAKREPKPEPEPEPEAEAKPLPVSAATEPDCSLVDCLID